jgi:hypothetical protein
VTDTPEPPISPADTPTEAQAAAAANVGPMATPVLVDHSGSSDWIPALLLGVTVLSFVGAAILGGALVVLRRS